EKENVSAHGPMWWRRRREKKVTRPREVGALRLCRCGGRARGACSESFERGVIPGGNGRQDSRGDRGERMDEVPLGLSRDRHIEQYHRHAPESVEGPLGGGACRDAEEACPIGDPSRIELRLEASGQLRHVVSRP